MIQWNISIVDTAGTQLAVLYREVSLIQRLICTQLYVMGTADSVLIREVSFTERFHCILYGQKYWRGIKFGELVV